MESFHFWTCAQSNLSKPGETIKTNQDIIKLDYDCVSKLLKEFFHNYHNLSKWTKEDKSIPGKYKWITYTECNSPDCTRVTVASKPGDSTSVVINEYHKDKKGKLINLRRSYLLKENGQFQSPELSLGYDAEKNGRPFGNENGALVKEQCDKLQRKNKSDVFSNAYNEVKSICSIKQFRDALP